MTLLDRMLGKIDTHTPQPPPGYDRQVSDLKHGVSIAALRVVKASADTARCAIASTDPRERRPARA